MHCVVWVYQVPPRLTKPAIEKLFSEVAERYLGVPGLVRKYFGFSEDGASVVGVYLWNTKKDADVFYSPDWMKGVIERWGAAPVRTDWLVPVVAESVEGKLVRG